MAEIIPFPKHLDEELLVWPNEGRWLVTLFIQGCEQGRFGGYFKTMIDAVECAEQVRKERPGSRLSINEWGPLA